MTVHVDDFIYSGTEKFENLLNSTILSEFKIGSHQEGAFRYLGLQIKQHANKTISVSQEDYINELKQIPLAPKRRNQKSHALAPDEYRLFRSKCGQLLWISLQTRPDISFQVCQISNHLSDPNVEDIIVMNKIIKNLQSEPGISLTFRAVNLNEMKLKVYSDSAYGNLPNHGSQCGYIIFLSDNEGKVDNPTTWKSVKIDRVCQSALGAEGLGFVKAVDHAIFLQKTVQLMINDETGGIPIEGYTDNKSLVEILHKTKDPEEKKLICSIAPIRDSIDRGEITVSRITSKEMPADILTKRGVNSKVIRFRLLND